MTAFEVVGVAVLTATVAGGTPPAAPAAAGMGAKTTMARERIELAGPWSFHKVTPGAVEPWLPATVPGCVHTDLLANGKIGDPFFRLNEKDQQWIENESWEYRTTLPVDAATLARERVDLV